MATPQAAIAMVAQSTMTAITLFIPRLRCFFGYYQAPLLWPGRQWSRLLTLQLTLKSLLREFIWWGFTMFLGSWFSVSSHQMWPAWKKRVLCQCLSVSSTVQFYFASPFPVYIHWLIVSPSSPWKHCRTTILSGPTSTYIFSWHWRHDVCICDYGCYWNCLLLNVCGWEREKGQAIWTCFWFSRGRESSKRYTRWLDRPRKPDISIYILDFMYEN